MENKKNDTSDRGIFLSRTVNAPVDLVWEMWTKPEHIANWWGPTGFTNTLTKMDLRVGGEWNLVMHGADGTDYPNRSVFTEIVKHRRIVFEHLSDPKSITTVEFEASGDKTTISWHMVFASAELFRKVVKEHNAVEGMKQNVEKLEAYISAKRFSTKTVL